MRLRNKKTGEIIENAYIRESHDFYNKRTIAVFVRDGSRPPERVSTGYETLAELNEEWEDAPEEPKKYWYISSEGYIYEDDVKYSEWAGERKAIGNYFETEEEAKKAVERLRAWKRLKDKGFEFINFPYKKICKYDARTGVGNLEYQVKYYEELEADLNLLFGGEE